MKTTSTVQHKMESYLRERGVRLDYAIKAGLRAVSATEAAALGSPWKREAILIPYIHPFKRLEELVRFRYLCDPLPIGGNGKVAKFGQPKGSNVEAYFDPSVDWENIARNSRIPVHFVEGEIKALAMNQRGLVTIGLGGVNSYGGPSLTPWLREVLG